ncbi:MFS transporter [Sphingomonas cannabina]|uniref:MFS transporter n=1 Tax=Sphingomonas cannabina TaxID=2899123 RepID=UPI001F2232F5|nr:MFS transporter [Sphingomonas cannabina]UIJ47109.1 MFS transporter [Sphingomonas cannabina]
MATIPLEAPVPAGRAEPLLTRSMLALSGLMLAAMSGFYLLLSAVPAHSATLDGDFAAGLATSVLMATTIAGELYAPRIISRLDRKTAMMVALLVLAVPAPASFSESLVLVLLSCAARGLGLGVLLVAACGLAAALAPPTRRAEAMGVYGLASAIPAILCVPLGPWVLAQLGPGAIGVVAAAVTLPGLACLVALPRHGNQPEQAPHSHRLPQLRGAAWPAVAIALSAIVIGATITFLPLAHKEIGTGTIVLALLLQGLGSAVARWASGRPVDRHGPQGAMTIGLALAVGAIVVLAFEGSTAVLAGVTLSGVAFGIVQTASLAQLLDRTPAGQADGASALWNAAYDAGLGMGGFVLGALATTSGYAAAFAITGGGIAVVALLVLQLFEAPRAAC